MNTTPSSDFATIARKTPIIVTRICGFPVQIVKACPVCNLELRPNQIHVVGGFECHAHQVIQINP